MVGVEGALPPDEPLGSGGELIGADSPILRRMPFMHELRMRDGNRVPPAVACINGAMKTTGTVRTVTPLAVIDRGVPYMMGIERTLPPDPLARIVRDVVRCQGAVLGGMPRGGEFW